MKRVHLRRSALSLLFVVTAGGWGGAAAAEETRPNVVLMMGDDHGWEETGYHGHPHVKTPVLDEMAATGLRLDRFYAAHPSCSPTRGSFLTGRHPNRYGTFAPGWSLRPEEVTVAKVMNEAGYRCGHFGKWHVGTVKKESPTSPGAMGFHEWVSHDNFFELDPSLSRNGGPPEVMKGEGSEVIIEETMRFIDRAKKEGKPFFTVVWFGSPHEPYSGLPADLALYDDLPVKYREKMVGLTSNETGEQVKRPQGEVLRERYAEITAMDRAIGKLRKHLAAQGLRENTLVFYCGDNGTSPDATLASPNRGTKGQVYEGGVLVPGLVEWPAKVPQPRTTMVRATTSDLLPTLCALTGAKLPEGRPLDGISVAPLVLDDGTMTVRPASAPLCFWEYDFGRLNKMSPRPEPYLDPELQKGTTPLKKLMDGIPTRNFSNYKHPELSGADYTGPRAIVEGRYKLVIHEGTPKVPGKGKGKGKGQAKGAGAGAAAPGAPAAVELRELFDLEADPAESSNLLEQQPEVAERLGKRLREWQESVMRSVRGGDYGG